MCTDKNIKELLPAYLKHQLEHPETTRVADHLRSCKDCCEEASLLRMMAGEAVPDPGDAFWAAMPDRVYRAVHEQGTGTKAFDLDRLMDWLVLPRRVWAGAAIGMVLVISWLILMPARTEQGPDLLSQGYEFADELMATDPADSPVNLAELGNDEYASVESWAGKELASIALEAEPVLMNGIDSDISEELGELNLQETERLSKMIDHLKEEG